MDATHIRNLFLKSLEGDLSFDEQQELQAWLNLPENQHLNDLRDPEKFREELKSLYRFTDRKDEVLAKILQKTRERQPPVRPFRLWRRVAAAAAIILVLGLTWLFIQQQRFNPTVKNTTDEQKDIYPQQGGAILSLGGGRTVTLDSSANGLLATQGKSNIIRQSGGEIIYIPTGQSSGTISLNKLETFKGTQQKVVLPDGSKITLNALSKIEYPSTFIGGTRNVSLSGEAFFEIAKDKSKPFVVDVNGINVQVTGTEFNVKAYGNEATIKSTLFEGSITVTSITKSMMTVDLAPGQEALVDTQSKQIKLVKMADLTAAAAWREGKFLFKDAPIEIVMRELQRYYDIDVKYSATITQKFNGEIPNSMPLATVLKVLEASGGVRLKVNGKTVTILQ